MTFKDSFPGLSRTLSFNFEDFPGPKWFSGTFQVLEFSTKKSRTFQEAWEPCLRPFRQVKDDRPPSGGGAAPVSHRGCGSACSVRGTDTWSTSWAPACWRGTCAAASALNAPTSRTAGSAPTPGHGDRHELTRPHRQWRWQEFATGSSPPFPFLLLPLPFLSSPFPSPPLCFVKSRPC